MTKRQVVITGLGAVTSLGNDVESTWRAALAGTSGADVIRQFDASSWSSTFACEVKNFTMAEAALAPEHRSYLSRFSSFGMQAAYEAMQDAGLADGLPRENLGISVGSGIGPVTPLEVLSFASPAHKYLNEQHTSQTLRNHPGTLAALLAARWRAEGPSTTIHTACASSGQSVGQAFWQILRGDADIMLAGGADSLSAELHLAGFCLIGTLSKRNDDPQAGSRPFDRDRDGFVAGEGAAMLVLEEKTHALKRGAHIYAELVGYGESLSAFRITDLHPEGRGVVEAMEVALQQSGLGYDAISYINAHGTSTELNDRVEAMCIRKIFGERGFKPLVSSTKSMTGHLISAAGALELFFCVMAIRDGKVPPTINLQATDCGDGLDLVANQARTAPILAALSNSVGFGGSNSALVVKRTSV